MSKKILIAEDEFAIAYSLELVLRKAGYSVCGIAASFEEAMKVINLEMPDMVLLDIYLRGEKTGIDIANKLRELDIAFVYLSSNSNQKVLELAKATQPYGFLVKPFREQDVLVTLDIAQYRHEHRAEVKLTTQVNLNSLIAAFASDSKRFEEQLLSFARVIQSHIPFDYLAAEIKMLGEASYSGCSYRRVGFDEYQFIGIEELLTISNLKMNALKALQEGNQLEEQITLYNGDDFMRVCNKKPMKKFLADLFNLRSTLIVPLQLSSSRVFAFSFYCYKHDAYNAGHLSLLLNLQKSLVDLANSMLLIRASDSQTISNYKQPLYPGVNIGFEGIVGKSPLMVDVFDNITRIAPLQTTVLVLGETGTGKEMVAHAIHNLSPRNLKPLIKVNCAALPSTLIESELFGHEKGSFTGANNQHIGKFEQADGGTIFLDEIGEMSLELQSKLLRVLQERELERIGSRSSVKIDVRIIAATNRNLEKEVAEGRFRLDLYYRLNIFPIHLPPLRARKEDIALLANHFAEQHCKKNKKLFNGIAITMLDQLTSYNWPGNIRELENTIEKAVVLSDDRSALTLKHPLDNFLSLELLKMNSSAGPGVDTFETLKTKHQQNEKEYILSILKKANGKIRGENGAAALLKLKPTTLESRMAKLGISKDQI